MLYGEYKSKLMKWERVFARFWHLRILYAAILLFVLAGIGTLMGVAGMVTEAEVAEVVSYGDPLPAQAKSLFGRNTSFEYRPVGGTEWSREQPRAAGDYECRPIGATVVGGAYHHGETYTFTVLPIEVDVRVAEGTLVYGEEPDFTANLAYDDVLVVDGYTSEAADGKLLIEAEAENIRVLDKDGEDVTGCYRFKTTPRSVTDVRRAVTLTTQDENFTYDGTAHTGSEAEIGGYGLVEGHRLEAVYPTLTGVGSQKNIASGIKVYDEWGADVTNRYSFTGQ